MKNEGKDARESRVEHTVIGEAIEGRKKACSIDYNVEGGTSTRRGNASYVSMVVGGLSALLFVDGDGNHGIGGAKIDSFKGNWATSCGCVVVT